MSTVDISSVQGNASPEVKALAVAYLKEGRKGYGQELVSSVGLVQVSFQENPEERTRKELVVVFKVVVNEAMLNTLDVMHGGCAAFPTDVCSSVALHIYSFAVAGEGVLSLSQSLNMVYHSPASLGDELRIVNKTVAIGGRSMTARTEIWNETKHRIVSSGVHIKMPIQPRSKL